MQSAAQCHGDEDGFPGLNAHHPRRRRGPVHCPGGHPVPHHVVPAAPSHAVSTSAPRVCHSPLPPTGALTGTSAVCGTHSRSARRTSSLECVWAPDMRVGMHIAAMKFLQRIVLVQMLGVSHPRVHLPRLARALADIVRSSRTRATRTSILFCASDHPFLAGAVLEVEGKQLLAAVTALLYTSQSVRPLPVPSR